MWHDAEGREPFWSLKDLEGIANGRFVYRLSSTHFINAHIEVTKYQCIELHVIVSISGEHVYLSTITIPIPKVK